ncbi:uncharacterized protein LOC130612389 [Hydractinia symbiolongicarpus]|uniref:uncharacterized protein LOC130612389 n=1 Tax=Hydractinia symbiolongicarpus TaxID=13093 RepID=UPI00254D522B|nr:uncharacterized protein LOC130612389 [Hydractinia symbiolongicarpus]
MLSRMGEVRKTPFGFFEPNHFVYISYHHEKRQNVSNNEFKWQRFKSASNDRSISMLRRAKTYLRSSMTQDRLNGLVLLNIHNKMKINLDDVTDMLAIKYPKRLKMLDIQNDV